MSLRLYFNGMRISTHAPHARRDQLPARTGRGHFRFLLTRLMRGATRCFTVLLGRLLQFLLTRLMRGATRWGGEILFDNFISTQPPHSRRDKSVHPCDDAFYISTHAPHARRDAAASANTAAKEAFLLTRLMRGATPTSTSALRDFFNFYSRASCEARPCRPESPFPLYFISTHAPHARRDPQRS